MLHEHDEGGGLPAVPQTSSSDLPAESVDRLVAELRRSRRELESLFESAPIGYFVLNKEGAILDVNLYGSNLLQADRKSLYEKPFIVFIARESHAQFDAHLHRVFDEARIQSHEMPIIDRRGRRIWGRFESRLQLSEEGLPRCLMAVVDVTERKRVEDDLILAREDAVNANRAKSLFLANMSHEIRTPMNGVLSMVELALESDLSHEQREWLEIIHDSARELTRVIDDVLDYSRIEADKLTLDIAPFSIREMLDATAALFRPQAHEKGIALRVDLDPELRHRYRGDRYRIRQVLYNLVGNAIKFTEVGEVIVEVRSQTISEYLHELTFAIQDTGIGIKESVRDTIFEGFQQGDNSYSKHYQGTGLGLTIARRLARLMSGQVYFTSVDGAGSTFYFTVPLHVESEPISHILIVEGSAVKEVVIRKILEQAGHTVESAKSVDEAIAKLETNGFDLVLLETGMPELCETDAARTIRERGDLIPIIGVTTKASDEERERCIAAGMDAYVTGPVSRDVLLAVVTELLESRRS